MDRARDRDRDIRRFVACFFDLGDCSLRRYHFSRSIAHPSHQHTRNMGLDEHTRSRYCIHLDDMNAHSLLSGFASLAHLDETKSRLPRQFEGCAPYPDYLGTDFSNMDDAFWVK